MERDGPDWDDLFLSAALEPETWVDALDTLAEHTGSARAQLIGIGGNGALAFNAVTNTDDAVMEQFFKIDGTSPDVNFRVRSALREPEMIITHEDDYARATQGLSTDVYLDFCHQFDLPYGYHSIVSRTDDSLIAVATLRSRADGKSRPEDRAIFARAARAVRNSVRLQTRMEGQQAQLLSGTLDQLRLPAFLLGGRGKVVGATERAVDLLDKGVIGMRDGQILIDQDQGLLEPFLAELCGQKVLEQPLAISIPRGQGRPPLALEGHRLPRRDWVLSDVPRALVICGQMTSHIADRERFLRDSFDLTPAEADIALALFRGEMRDAISARRAVRLDTLRGQINSIYAKAGVTSEASLMRLLNTLLG